MRKPPWFTSAVAAIVMVAAMVRLLIMVATGSFDRVHVGEIDNIAVSIASGRGFADAYAPGTGPTTHYTPGQPLLIAACYAAFGIDSNGELARQLQRLLFSCVLFGALPWIALRFGLPARAGLFAGLLGAALPLHVMQELRGSGAILDSIFIAALCVVTFPYWSRENEPASANRFGLAGGLRHGLLIGVACLFNPVIAAVAAGLGLYAFYRFAAGRRRVAVHYCTAAAVTALCLLPWGLYNYSRMGRFVLTRGNLPLEMSLSFHPKAEPLLKNAWIVPGAYPHPSADAAASERVRQLGEAAFMEERKQQAVTFLRENPGRALRLIAQRFFYFWFPDNGRLIQNIGFWLLTLAALAGVGVLFRRREPAFPVFGVILLFYPAVYYLQMADTQYRLTIYWVFLLLSGIFADFVLPSFGQTAAADETVKSI